MNTPSGLAAARPRVSGVREVAFVGDDEALVAGLRAGNPAARAALFDRYAGQVQRILWRVLGADPEVEDLLQEVFLQALASIDKLDDATALGGWLSSVAIFTARGCIRRRQRRRWLRLVAPADLPETPTAPSAEASAALRTTYRALDTLPADERIAFALRFVDGMELTEVADACGCSLATIKRRISRAKTLFFQEAIKHAELRGLLEEAGWTDPHKQEER